LKLENSNGNIAVEVLLSFFIICSAITTFIPIIMNLEEQRISQKEQLEKRKLLTETIQHYLLTGEVPKIHNDDYFLHSKKINQMVKICVNKVGDNHDKKVCQTIKE
jgi:hypothetical protein